MVVEVEGGREGTGHEDCVQDEVVRREKLGVNGVIRKKDMYRETERRD